MQALIDTRSEIERWTNHSIEFHFATILSPWIRRSLVAGGFGYDHRLQSPTWPHDVAAVAPYDVAQGGPSSLEAGETKGVPLPDASYGTVDTVNCGEGPAVQVDTPFFHLDLAEAVAAAEAGLLRLSPQWSAEEGKDGKHTDVLET